MLRGTPVTDFICVYFGCVSSPAFGGQEPNGKWWSITARGFVSARAAESVIRANLSYTTAKLSALYNYLFLDPDTNATPWATTSFFPSRT